MLAGMTLAMTWVCTCCGSFDVPSDPGRRGLIAHYDPLNGLLCPGETGTLMLLVRRTEAHRGR